MSRAGRFRHYIPLYKQLDVADSTGQPAVGSAGQQLVEHVFAEVIAAGGSEMRRGLQIEAGVTTIVTTRHNSNITPTTWFTHQGRRLDVVRAYDPTGRNVETECQCKEVV